MNEIEKYYQLKAQDFVDALYEKGYFKTDVKRAEMQEVENLLAWLFQTDANSVRKVCEINRRLKPGEETR